MPLITTQNLSKSFLVGDKRPGLKGTLKHFVSRKTRLINAVNNISIEIDQGEMVGFIGPNGAGKTTTLKMLCGLIHPTNGHLNVAGYVPQRRQHDFLKKITLVMGQKQQLIWDLPPLDSLKVNAAVYGLSNEEAQRRIEELSEMLDLGDELTCPVRKLSLGQRMKAELLASLLHRPSILFLDEPTLGLDVNAQVRVREFISNYNNSFGATILLTSHYMGDITSLCKRVILIHDGTLFYDGMLEDLITKLSPCRSVRLELTEPQPVERFLPFGEVVHHQKYLVRLLIPRAKLTSSLATLINSCSVKDLEVSDPPIEKLIGDLFKSGQTPL